MNLIWFIVYLMSKTNRTTRTYAPTDVTTHPLLADMAADRAYLASHGVTGRAIVDTRTDAERAASNAKQAALMAACVRPVVDGDL